MSQIFIWEFVAGPIEGDVDHESELDEGEEESDNDDDDEMPSHVGAAQAPTKKVRLNSQQSIWICVFWPPILLLGYSSDHGSWIFTCRQQQLCVWELAASQTHQMHRAWPTFLVSCALNFFGHLRSTCSSLATLLFWLWTDSWFVMNAGFCAVIMGSSLHSDSYVFLFTCLLPSPQENLLLAIVYFTFSAVCSPHCVWVIYMSGNEIILVLFFRLSQFASMSILEDQFVLPFGLVV